MRTKADRQPLFDHGDMRMVAAETGELISNRNSIVRLDPDHPGFTDPHYRMRRNRIADIALNYRTGRPIPNAPYAAAEHEVWRTIWKALEPAHQRHACAEYLDCLRRLGFERDRIPQLQEVSDKIYGISGFRLEPVAGLVEPRVFLENLAGGVFLCTQYIRHHSTPLYTPEPDVAHEIIGHAVTLASERFAELNRMFGAAVKRSPSLDALECLSHVYWFTIEFGVLLENGALKAYGTGLLSSAGELEEMHRAEIRPLDFDVVSRHEYDPSNYQPVLFCAQSFDELYRSLNEYLRHWGSFAC